MVSFRCLNRVSDLNISLYSSTYACTAKYGHAKADVAVLALVDSPATEFIVYETHVRLAIWPFNIIPCGLHP